MDGAAVTQFMSLTGTDAETARLWLAASAGAGGAVDVQAALSIYFEAQGSGGPAAGGGDDDGEEDPAAAALARGRGGGGAAAAAAAVSRGGLPASSGGRGGPSAPPPARRGGGARGGRGGGIATLNSLRDDGDEEEVRVGVGWQRGTGGGRGVWVDLEMLCAEHEGVMGNGGVVLVHKGTYLC